MKRKKAIFIRSHLMYFHSLLCSLFRFWSTFDAPFAISLAVCLCELNELKSHGKINKMKMDMGMCARAIVLNAAES